MTAVIPVLTETDVLDIWARLAAAERATDIAAHYGVTKSTICKIKNGRTWKHIDPGPLAAAAHKDRCRRGHLRTYHGYRTRGGHTRCRVCRRASHRSNERMRRRRAQATYRQRHAGHDVRVRSNGIVYCFSCWCGETRIDQAVLHRVKAGFPPDYMTVAERRAAILWCAGQGMGHQAIARRVGVCTRTVERHLAAVRGAA